MSKVLKLRRTITSLLREVHPRVYYERAPKDEIYPYLVYVLDFSVDDGSLENFVLEVDGWDAPEGGVTTALETMMDTADSVLNRAALYLDGGYVLHIRRDNRRTIDDDDSRISRRQYVYQARVFERRDQ